MAVRTVLIICEADQQNCRIYVTPKMLQQSIIHYFFTIHSFLVCVNCVVEGEEEAQAGGCRRTGG